MPLRTGNFNIPRLRLLLAIGACLWFLGLCWWNRRVVMDDPWITYRYSANLLAGEGWVFNPGEHVEGYSNFTWVLCTIPALAVEIEPLSWARGGSIALALATFLLLALKEEDEDGPPTLRTDSAALLLAGSYPFAVWTMGGLETAAVAVLVMAFVAALAHAWVHGRTRDHALWAVLLLLICLSRPEGAMYGALVLPVLLWPARTADRRPILIAGAGVALAFLAYNVWRYTTYGHLLPNSVRAKVGGSTFDALSGGAHYTARYLLGTGGVLSALAAWAAIRAWRGLRRDGSEALAVVPAAAILTGVALAMQLAFVLGTGGDWMPAARFFVPVIGAACLAAGALVHRWPLLPRLAFLALFLAAGVVEAKLDRPLNFCRWLGKVDGGTTVARLQEVARDIRTMVPEGALLAGSEAGIVPYVAQVRFIDMLGLVDPHIASLEGGLHRKADGGYVLSREPEYILLGFTETEGGLAATWAPDAQVAAHPDFAAHYIERRRWDRLMTDGSYGALLPGKMILFERRAGASAQRGDAPAQ